MEFAWRESPNFVAEYYGVRKANFDRTRSHTRETIESVYASVDGSEFYELKQNHKVDENSIDLSFVDTQTLLPIEDWTIQTRNSIAQGNFGSSNTMFNMNDFR